MPVMSDCGGEVVIIKGKERYLIKGTSEGYITRWFEKNYKLLGINRILRKQNGKTPDYIAERNGMTIRIECEFHSSDFLKHKHKIEDIDVILCAVKDIDIHGIEIIRIEDYDERIITTESDDFRILCREEYLKVWRKEIQWEKELFESV